MWPILFMNFKNDFSVTFAPFTVTFGTFGSPKSDPKVRKLTKLESTVSRDIDVLRRPFFHQSKAESLRNPVSKELAPEDASISRYGRFEPGRFHRKSIRRQCFSPPEPRAGKCCLFCTPNCKFASIL